MTKSALLLIDIQNDYFPGGKWEVDGIEPAAANAARLLSDARAKGLKVIHIHHEIPAEGAPFFQPGTDGAKINQSVAPEPGETAILKHFPSSFRETTLGEVLKADEITDLIICGAMSQMCVDTTTRAAADLGYTVTVVHDACAARAQSFNGIDVPAEQVHAAHMAALNGPFAQVLATEAVIG